MSEIAFTPTVAETMRKDLQSGRWSPVTQQFFALLVQKMMATALDTRTLQLDHQQMGTLLQGLSATVQDLQTQVAALRRESP